MGYIGEPLLISICTNKICWFFFFILGKFSYSNLICDKVDTLFSGFKDMIELSWSLIEGKKIVDGIISKFFSKEMTDEKVLGLFFFLKKPFSLF